MKKRVLSKIVMVGTSVLLLAAMMVSTLLGTTSAMYEKSLSQKLDIKATPDLALSYFGYCGKAGVLSGTYKDAENIHQTLYFAGTSGSGLRYQIAIPVTEEGYYNLSFTYDMIQNEDETVDFSTVNLNAAVGCQVVSEGAPSTSRNGKNNVRFAYTDASGKIDEWKISKEADSHYNGTLTQYTDKRLYSADDNYMWKTVAPARAEEVNLTFKVDATDVKNGYVIWVWDFSGLPSAPLAANGTNSQGKAYTRYDLSLTNVSYDKIVNENENAPYIDFTGTQYKNMAIMPNSSTDLGTGQFTTSTPTRHDKTIVKGVDLAGITRSTVARGTYVTDATYSGMTMQAEPLYFAANPNLDNAPWVDSDLSKDKGDKYDYSNPIVFNVPVKNVKQDTKYKITFDFSVAKQGSLSVNEAYHASENADNFKDYKPKLNGDKFNTDAVSSTNEANSGYFFSNKSAKALLFQSYMHIGTVSGFNTDIHSSSAGRMQLTLKDVRYPNHEIVRFNEITATSMDLGATTLDDSTCDNYNDYACSTGYTNKTNLNWLNAYRHVEYNGENFIYWLTFKNTTCTFDVGSSNSALSGKVSANGVISDLYWVWALDILDPSAWYRIRIDNLRIEEVVHYGSNIGDPEYQIAEGVSGTSYNNVGVRLGSGTVITNSVYNIKGMYRGSNGSGQNYNPRSSTGMEMTAMNIYGPNYNMKDVSITKADMFKIYLSGYCVVKGGVDRYVWSIDNGKTWHDMIVDEPIANASVQWSTDAKNWIDGDVENPPENVIYKSDVSESVVGDKILWAASGLATWKSIDSSRIRSANGTATGQLQVKDDSGNWKNAVYIRRENVGKTGTVYFYSKNFNPDDSASTWTRGNPPDDHQRIFYLPEAPVSKKIASTANKNITTFKPVSSLRENNDGNLEVKIGNTWYAAQYMRRTDAGTHQYTRKYDQTGWTTTVSDARTVWTFDENYAIGNNTILWSQDKGTTWNIADKKAIPSGKTQIWYREDPILKWSEYRVDASAQYVNDPVTKKNFIDFTDKDGANADFTGYKIYADLSDYKHISSMNVIFAAVPRDNPDARCEIFRIENFNETLPYLSTVSSVSSDIQTSKGAVTNSLSVQSLATGTGVTVAAKKKKLGEIAGATAPNNVVYYDSYAPIQLNAAYNYHKEKMSIDYDNLMTLFSDIPIKTTLSVSGWIASYGGVQGYYWSADGGKTWNKCTQTAMESIADGDSTVTGYVETWLTTNATSKLQYLGTKGPNGKFDTAASQLKIDLSAYAGQVVDVIVAAQPKNRFSYSPIARIDNVAVYGDGFTDKPNDRGTFFTRVNEVYVNGGKIPDNFTAKYEDTDIPFTYLDKWNTSIDSTYSSSGLTYTPFEVCNTDIFHVRKASATPLYVTNGGEIKLSGFVACPNGVNNYKYTLDGGITWTDINDTVADFYTGDGNNTAYVTNIKRVSSDLNEGSLKNGNFMNSTGYYDTTIGWNPLTINLPNDLAEGDVRDLLVVAESNNASGEHSDKLYPVFHQTIKVVGGNAETPISNVKKGTTVTLSKTVANLQENSYVINYSAIPEFSVSKTTTSGTYNGSSMSLAKTCFNVGEDIIVNYTLTGLADPKIWIAIGKTGDYWDRYQYIPKNSKDKISGSININDYLTIDRNNKPAGRYNPSEGEYDIWIIAKDKPWNERDDYSIVAPIRIKIVDPNNPDYNYRSDFMGANGITPTQTLKLYYTKPDGTAGDETIPFTNQFINVKNKVINVKPGTQVKVVAEYKNISTIKRVDEYDKKFKFTIKPNSTT